MNIQRFGLVNKKGNNIIPTHSHSFSGVQAEAGTLERAATHSHQSQLQLPSILCG